MQAKVQVSVQKAHWPPGVKEGPDIMLPEDYFQHKRKEARASMLDSIPR